MQSLMSKRDDERLRIFEAFFQDGDETVIRLKKQALSCNLSHTHLRIVSWKMFLGLLSTPPRAEEWTKEVNCQRGRYAELKSKHAESSLDGEDDPNFNNPLSLHASSPWSQHFENQQLRKTIMQDVDRTYPEYTFFQQAWVKDLMAGILFIYSKENQEVSYKQGMHELLAPIIYLLDKEKMKHVEGNFLSFLLDEKSLESDAFTIFERLMKTTGSWFITKPSKPTDTNTNPLNSNNTNLTHPNNPNQPTFNSSNQQNKELQESPILIKCLHIYHDLLKSKDPGLYAYITSLKIEPQLFLLRWIRLLFGREFKLSETLALWDAIFAFDKAFTLIDYIAVSMLMAIRDQILSSDQNGVLQVLFKYPPLIPSTMGPLYEPQGAAGATGVAGVSGIAGVAVAPGGGGGGGGVVVGGPSGGPSGEGGSSIQGGTQESITSIFIQHALQMAQKPKKKKKQRPTHPPQSNPAPSSKAMASAKAASIGLVKGLSGLAGLSGNHSHHNNHEKPEVDSNYTQLKSLHSNVAVRLENIVSILQTHLLPNEKQTPDNVLLAVAELKQIKDVMLGNLPLEALPTIQPDPKMF